MDRCHGQKKICLAVERPRPTVPPVIVVVSTRTVDHVPATRDRPGHDLPGGPAHYVGHALDALECPWTLITGESVETEVIQTENGEAYLIPPIPYIPLPPRFEAEAAILSPIMREIPPHNIPPCSGLLVIDLQGFVRTLHKPTNYVGAPIDLTELLRRTDVVKGSPDEIERLDAASREALKGTILATTYGSRGVMLSQGRVEHFIAGEPVETPNTIGAGDIFLAALTVFLLEHERVEEAGIHAVRFTESMLRRRAAVPK